MTQNPRVPRGLARGQNPLPMEMTTRLAYNQRINISAGASADALTLYVFNASSMYDPDYSGTGHQPLGYDQLAAMYDHWVVRASRIACRFIQNAETANTPLICGVSGSAVVTPKTSSSQYIEQAATNHSILALDPHAALTLKQAYNPRVHMGIPDALSADKLQGTETANPTDNWFYHVWVQPTNPDATTGNITIDVTIEYLATFMEPKQLAQS